MYKKVYTCLIILIVGLSGCRKDEFESNTIIDIDGNVYNTILIGSQLWMTENLRTRKYSDGSLIPDVQNMRDLSFQVYGGLYSWSSAMRSNVSSNINPSGIQGACPTDWHLPSESEWKDLANYLGGSTISGGKMKEADYLHWKEPNTGATNESGFTALPGGRIYSYYPLLSGVYGFYWSSTGSGTSVARAVSLSNKSVELEFINMQEEAYISVRCVRNY